jgi:hypothetical protein
MEDALGSDMRVLSIDVPPDMAAEPDFIPGRSLYVYGCKCSTWAGGRGVGE